MTTKKTRILLIEDNPGDVRLIEEMFREAYQQPFPLESACTLAEACGKLPGSFYDVILLDFALPDSSGLESIKEIKKVSPKTPIIMLTGLDDEETAISTLRMGAQDYLVKGRIDGNSLLRSIRYAIERKLVEADMKILMEKLTKSNRELEQFAAIVSHDLQTPLISAACGLKFLRRRIPDPDALDLVDSVLERIISMQMLVRKLLEYSLAGRAGQAHSSGRVDTEKILMQAIDLLREKIDACGGVISHEGLSEIRGDPVLLRQVFQNLIDNAIKFRSDRPLHVHVSAEKKAGEWVFSVSDNGKGIEPGKEDQVFDMFSRYHKNISGSGIGLATCKKIIEMHGGKIRAESESGKGTTFFFTIPAEGDAASSCPMPLVI